MGILQLFFYILGFAVLAFGSNLIITTINKFTRRIKVPPFILSFFVVGILTSIGEIAVAINAVSIHKPEIFVGSLLGGTLVIFSIILPIMAILSGRVNFHHLNKTRTIILLAIIATPALFILDQHVTNIEACILIGLYLLLFIVIPIPRGTFERAEKVFIKERKTLRENTLFRLSLGAILIFFASRYIVEQTVTYSSQYHLSTFVVSLVVIAIGMNLPELSLAIKAGTSRDSKTTDIALGDLMGSAAANVIIFGVFSLINSGDVVTTKNFVVTFVFIILILGSFFVFTMGKRVMTPLKSIALISAYVLFVLVQEL